MLRELEASQRDEKELETFIDTKQKELEEWKEEEASQIQRNWNRFVWKNPHWNSRQKLPSGKSGPSYV